MTSKNRIKPLLAVDWQKKADDGTRIWTWFFVTPGAEPRFHMLGLVQEVSVENAYTKAIEILRPKSRWISRRINRILEIEGKPTIMAIIRSDGLWNVYDLRTGCARLVAVDVPNWEMAKGIAEDHISP